MNRPYCTILQENIHETHVPFVFVGMLGVVVVQKLESYQLDA